MMSLILPAHNEERRLPETLSLYAATFRSTFGSDFELLVVANGCVDNTVDVARTAARLDPAIRVVEVPARIGKGGAVLTGFDAAEGERVVFADADAATPPDSLLALIDQLDRYDIAIGSRRLPGSVIVRKQPRQRQVLSRCFALTTRLLFGLPYHDTQCGAKAFRGPVAKALAREVHETGWTFDIDLLLAARALGATVTEVPVTWESRDGSKLSVLRTAPAIAQALVRLKRHYTNRKRSPMAPAFSR